MLKPGIYPLEAVELLTIPTDERIKEFEDNACTCSSIAVREEMDALIELIIGLMRKIITNYDSSIFSYLTSENEFKLTAKTIDLCRDHCENLNLSLLTLIDRKEEADKQRAAVIAEQEAKDLEENKDAASIRVLLHKGVMDIKLKHEKYNEEIIFILNGGIKIRFITSNYTWIESVEGIENIIDEEIIEVVEKDMENIEGAMGDCIKLYNVDLVSKRGTCTIDFRSSDDYYGGSLVRSWSING